MANQKNREIINFKCPKCGCEKSYRIVTSYFEGGECISCGELTYYQNKKTLTTKIKTNPSVTCPYCHSNNVKKISNTSRIADIVTLGIFSSKLGKQWHCNNCKSNF